MPWLFAIPLLAFGAPERMYETRNLQLSLTLPVVDALHIRQMLKQELAPYRIKTFTVIDEDGATSRVRLGKLGVPESLAVLTVLAHQAEAVEVDLVVPDLADKHYPVTVWWEGPSIALSVGDPIGDLIGAGRTPESISRDYGLTTLQSGPSRIWEPRSAALLAQALDLLGQEELRGLANVPFVRSAVPSATTRSMTEVKDNEQLYAAFVVDAKGPRIEIYDHALMPATRFVGDPWSPKPDALRTLLHEMAHALAFSEFRASVAAVLVLLDELETLTANARDHVDRMNQLVAQYNMAPSRAIHGRLQEMKVELERYRERQGQIQRDIEASDTGLEIKRRSAAAVAFEAVLAGKSAPTWYGQRSAEEAFAECYSLFLADPAALDRALPEAYAWFEARNYMPYLSQPAVE